MLNQRKIFWLHRYLSLAMVLFWFIQVVSGLLITFRWELDDQLLGGEPEVFDLEAFSKRLQRIQADERYRVYSVWASGGQPDRYDIYLEEIGTGDMVMRINGKGEILRQRKEGQWLREGGIFDSATNLHATFFAGDVGHWIIGFSGLLLFTNILFGLKLAWPKRRRWRRILTHRPHGTVVTRLYGWHRLLGLWIGIMGLSVALLGGMLALSEPVQDGLGWGSPTPPSSKQPLPFAPDQPYPVTPGQAIRTALQYYPGAEFSGMYPPDEEEPWYTVRLLSIEEPRQKYGKTAVLIDPRSGAVLVKQGAVAYPRERRLVNSLFPLHTGQIAGTSGRILVLLTGLWLLTMMTLGFFLYLKRRASRS